MAISVSARKKVFAKKVLKCFRNLKRWMFHLQFFRIVFLDSGATARFQKPAAAFGAHRLALDGLRLKEHCVAGAVGVHDLALHSNLRWRNVQGEKSLKWDWRQIGPVSLKASEIGQVNRLIQIRIPLNLMYYFENTYRRPRGRWEAFFEFVCTWCS